jgi:DUF1365 family protein
VRHRRRAPIGHGFRYPHAMVAVDAADPSALEAHPWFGWHRPAPVRFHRADYLGPAELPLDEAARRCVREQTGLALDGRVEILTQPRAWGYSFNPVSFYLCHDRAGNLRAIVAEITNTPWLERHAYALAVPEGHPAGAPITWEFAKRFHISPFNPMRQTYRWSFVVRPDAFAVHMVNLDQDGSTVFDATLACRRHRLGLGTLARVLRMSPLLNLQVALRIYLQAKNLWRKGAVFHTHPVKLATAGA